MEYLKPQSPIKIGENYIYPLTTSDQIINGNGERIKNIADTNEICYLYSATFSVDSWQGEGPYTQTATLTAVDGGGQVTVQSTLLACVGIDSTLPQETKDAMQSAASDIINAEKTLGTNTISVSLTKKPDVEVELYFLIKEGNGTNVPTLNPVEMNFATIDLLWTNPTPSASFSPQSIQLNGKYDAFYISFFAAANNNEQMQTQMVVVDNGATTQRIGFVNYYTNIGTRDTTVYKNLIAFGNSNSGSGGSTNNANIIPYKIYGVSFSGDISNQPIPVNPGWTLLWSNPTPSDSFPPQVVNVDFSKYDMLGIYGFDSKNIQNATPITIVQISLFTGNDRTGMIVGSPNNGRVRTFTLVENGISFSTGLSISTQSNDVCIPAQIYGIKF